MTNACQYALNYAAQGYRVFPLIPGTKFPTTKNGFKNATTDEDQISRWWGQNPNCGVGLATGHDLTVIDIDPRNWGDLTFELWRDIIGAVPETSRCTTGGNGTHLYFRTSAQMRCGSDLIPGIDLKSDGGYVVAPPSRHPNGGTYHSPPGIGLLDMSPIELPANILEELKMLKNLKYKVDKKITYSEGSRNDSLFALAMDMRRKGVPDNYVRLFMKVVNTKACKPPLAQKELEQIIESSSRYKVTQAQSRSGEGVSKLELARSYLEASNLVKNGSIGFQYYQDSFFEYQNGVYVERPEKEVLARVTRYLQSSGEKKAEDKAHGTVFNLKGLRLLDGKLPLPIVLEEENAPEHVPGLISLKNGVIDLDAEPLHVFDHSPKHFVTSQLAYDFDPSSKCPTWLRALSEILPDSEERRCLQQFFGYCLSNETWFGKFLMLYGQGANGKGVINCVLREMLGPENTTGIGLEGFDPSRTFTLAQLNGKKANIIEEVNETSRTSEGLLKNLVTGEPITVERKHRDPFEMRNTAKFIIATNTKPRFMDRSDGLWRRMILLPLEVQFLDPTKQDKRLVDPKFWRQSGELSGVLNWAIQGLVDLKKSRAFAESSGMREAREAYRSESNPAASFLSEHFCESAECESDRKTVYQTYSEWARSHGYHPLSDANFNEEVLRRFPSVTKPANPVNRAGFRIRVWKGLKKL